MRFVNSLVALAASSFTLALGADPKFPLEDSFYNATKDELDKAGLGDVLKVRDVPEKLTQLKYHKAYQILYKSQNTFNDSLAAVTTLVFPNGDYSKDQLISYQIPEDAAYIGCAESYTMQMVNSDSAIQDILDQGVVVSFPDYEGPQSAFGAGILEGYLVLDSIKAVLSSGKGGLDKNAKVGIWGYSGGSIGSGWANQLAPSYASDLDIKGVAVGGYVANLTATALELNNGPFAGFAAGAMMGLANEYPDIKKLEYSDTYENRTQLFKIWKQCMVDDLEQFAYKDAFSYFKDGIKIMDRPEVAKILDSLNQGFIKPAAPMYVYQGLKDIIVPPQSVKNACSDFCKIGAQVQLYLNPKTDHTGQEAAGRFYALSWLLDRLNGKAADEGCSTYTTKYSPKTAVGGEGSSNATASATSATSAGNSSSTSTPSATTTGSSGASSNNACISLVAAMGLSLLVVAL